MNRYPRLPLLLLSAALLAGSPLFAQTAFIEGRVTTETGVALPGMTVAAYTSAGVEARTVGTDANGRYQLPLAPATYRVLAYDLQGTWATSFYNDASSFETSAEITLAAGESRSEVNLRLRPAMRVQGMVQSSTGTPLPGMVVAAYNLDGTRRGFQKSGTNGAYTLSLPAGQYKLAAWDDALTFAPEFYSNARSFSTASTVTVTSNVFSIDFSLDLGAKVAGKAWAAGSAQPLPGIEISAYDAQSGERIASALTRADGEFLGKFLFGLPPGKYKFGATDPKAKYAPEFFSNAPSFAAAASFDLAGGESRSGVDFDLVAQSDPPAPTTLFIPAVINAPGAGGSYWRTDVWIYNPTQDTLTITASYLPGTGPATQTTIIVEARAQVEISNIVDSRFATSGLGALRLRAPRPFAAVSRTFNTPPNSAQVGTFGFSIAAMDTASTLGLAVLPGVAETDAYRTNFGVMNPHEHPITVRARLYSSGGALVGDAKVTLAPMTVQQPNVSNFFGSIRATEAYLVLSSEDGSFFSYASIVDIKSGDPTLVLPTADEEQ